MQKSWVRDSNMLLEDKCPNYLIERKTLTVTMATYTLKMTTISKTLYKRGRYIHSSFRSIVTKIDTVQQFNSIIQDAKKLVVVDYYADWCVPCKRMAPVFERLSNEYDDKCEFLAVDIDRVSDLVQQLQIQSIPTFDFIKSKKLINRLTGELPRELEQRIIDLSKTEGSSK